MIKYFIENKDGEWLSSPDHYVGKGWTRDPNKALSFNENLGISQYQDDWNYVKIRNIAHYLVKECMIDLQITEHEFVEEGPGVLYDKRTKCLHMGETKAHRKKYPDGHTITWVHHPMFDK